MGKSQQTFNKKEREKKRRKKKQDKLERREQRKLEKAEKGKLSFEDQIQYVDENGNTTSTPPDPKKKKKIKVEDIIIGAAPKGEPDDEIQRIGKVENYLSEKGFGFIVDAKTQVSVFFHINDAYPTIQVRDQVTFETEMGPKGPRAIQVRPQE
ncbi:MAG: cold shock domain-containing protein [Bacteroidota bacterium]